MATYRISLGAVKRAFSVNTSNEWGYGAGYGFELENGEVYGVVTDKPGLAVRYGFVPVDKLEVNEDGIYLPAATDRNYNLRCFDPVVVATVAAGQERFQTPGVGYPMLNQAIFLPTKEEALAIYRRLHIPEDEDRAQDIYAECVEVGLDGKVKEG